MFTVQILGNSSATPAFNRFPSSQLINFNDRYYLMDAGEGVQMQLQRYHLKLSRIDAIFISHLHADHILGLPGLLASLSIFERNTPIVLVGPRGLLEILELIFRHSDTILKYKIDFFALEDFAPGDIVFQTDRLKVTNFELYHRTFCRGYRFGEQNKRRKFNFFKAKELDVPREYFHLLKQENDVTLPDGRKVTADEVLLERESLLSYSYCSDTRFDERIVEQIAGSTLLYHEATFMESLRNRADQTWHSTARDAGRMAALAQVSQLAIGHFSARYRDLEPLLEEARLEFPSAELALEGRIFDLRTHVQ